MKKAIQVAVIGCGAVARHYYAPALSRLTSSNRVYVKSLYDPEIKNLTALSNMFPGSSAAQKWDDLKELEIDLAIIASPAAYHASQCIEIMEAGSSVLCEKPMASSLADCQLMIEAAKKYDKILAVGHFRRFIPALKTIKEIIDSGVLGGIRSFKFSEGGPFQWPSASNSFFKKTTAGGGVFLDLGAHVIDILLWWFGQPSGLNYKDDAMGGVEANCRLDLEFSDKFAGSVRLSRDWWLDNKYEIDFEEASLCWKALDTKTIDLKMAKSEKQIVSSIDEILRRNGCSTSVLDGQDHYTNYFYDQLESVIDLIDTKRPNENIVLADEAKRCLAVIEQCYRQRQLIDMPWLTGSEVVKAKALQKMLTEDLYG